MLNDTERKILRILYNQFRNGEGSIEIKTISRFAQREQHEVVKALRSLADQNMILWASADKRERVTVIRAEEKQHAPKPTQSQVYDWTG
ncbi:hypothetical protein [Paenibacillus sp. MMS18-CY102]|uniref:hypothetical protein n=1 Tax=Paenibacillus sp. MMS18-CY102 TaxID=2682849 RepID=UPI0013660F8A|nr:hypothetical protein [Paenibacillus sp. MMS18-CY102]MWC26618.1 hypothetical protein [Paenibacillus sp. MMS18-CY102]